MPALQQKSIFPFARSVRFFTGLLFFQLDVDLGISLDELCYDRGEDTGIDVLGASNPYGPSFQSFDVTDFGLQVGFNRHHFFDTFDIEFAYRSQSDGFALPIKKRHMQMILYFFYSHTEGRLGNVELFGSLGKTA